MKNLLKLLLLLFLQSIVAYGQDPLPELSRTLASKNGELTEKQIFDTYASALSKKKYAANQLALWQFYWIDSIGSREAIDSIALGINTSNLKGNDLLETEVYRALGNIQRDNDQYEKAIGYYHKAIKVANHLNESAVVARFKTEIGKSYLKLDQSEPAIYYLKQAYDYYSEVNNEEMMANVSISLGNGYKESGNLDKGEFYYLESLNYAKKLNNERLIAGNYNNLGNIERRRKNYQGAIKYFELALAMNVKSKNRLWESFNYNNLGNTYNDLGQYAKAIESFKKSNEIKVEIGDEFSLIAGYIGISEAYSKLGNYDQAYKFLKDHNRLKDSLGIAEQAAMLKDLEAKYKSENQELEIDRLKTAEALQNEINKNLEIESQKNFRLVVVLILAAIILLGGVALLWKSNKAKQANNRTLNSKNIEIEKTNNALNGALMELSLKNKEIIDSINYATHIQQASLPNLIQHSNDILSFELFFQPKDIVSGDFYFSYEMYQKSIFGVADCTGHGVPGAMVSLIGMNSLDKIIRDDKHANSEQMVTLLNEYMNENLQRGAETVNDGMDIGFCQLEHETRKLHFCGANHNAYIIRANELIQNSEDLKDCVLRHQSSTHSMIEIKGTRRPIGKSYTEEPFTQKTIQLCANDRIVLFSDGFADQLGGHAGKKMKKSILLDQLVETANLSTKMQINYLGQYFKDWMGNAEQLDDVCLMLVKVK